MYIMFFFYIYIKINLIMEYIGNNNLLNFLKNRKSSPLNDEEIKKIFK